MGLSDDMEFVEATLSTLTLSALRLRSGKLRSYITGTEFDRFPHEIAFMGKRLQLQNTYGEGEQIKFGRFTGENTLAEYA